MRKYLSIFNISFQQEFVYRLNFIMWRVRNVFQIFLLFFLWDAVFSDPNRVVFGYDRAKILTYVFGILIIKAFVFSARAVDVAGQVANGDILNYLVKPVNFFRYWLVRDISSKALNLIFAVVEITILFLILRPPFFLQTNLIYLLAFVASLILAIFMYFSLLMITNTIPFLAPELAWGGHFLVIVTFTEFLSGSLFPIDILPLSIQRVLMFTPFPYLIFFPLEVYLGKIATSAILGGLFISLFWTIVLWVGMNFFWKKGLQIYEAYGR